MTGARQYQRCVDGLMVATLKRENAEGPTFVSAPGCATLNPFMSVKSQNQYCRWADRDTDIEFVLDPMNSGAVLIERIPNDTPDVVGPFTCSGLPKLA
jgi:hypothetical protein